LFYVSKQFRVLQPVPVRPSLRSSSHTYSSSSSSSIGQNKVLKMKSADSSFQQTAADVLQPPFGAVPVPVRPSLRSNRRTCSSSYNIPMSVTEC
jgi:hypothetical protein